MKRPLLSRMMAPLLLSALLAGVGLGQVQAQWSDEDGETEDAWPDFEQPLGSGAERSGAPEYACRAFRVSIDDGQGGYFETSDRTSPIGEWVFTMESMGWSIERMDFELGQELTGFPMAQVMVCVSRSR